MIITCIILNIVGISTLIVSPFFLIRNQIMASLMTIQFYIEKWKIINVILSK